MCHLHAGRSVYLIKRFYAITIELQKINKIKNKITEIKELHCCFVDF